MDIDSDTFVINAARHGSEQAWRQLFEHHFDAVYRFCVALTGARHDLAEELTQQVFVIAARRIQSFDPSRAAFRAWLFGIAKNRHLTVRTSDQRRKHHEESSAQARSETLTPEDTDLGVHEALARLPSHYRIVLEEKYLKGFTLKEIAAHSRASIGAIESLLRRARARFAAEYEQIRTLDQ